MSRHTHRPTKKTRAANQTTRTAIANAFALVQKAPEDASPEELFALEVRTSREWAQAKAMGLTDTPSVKITNGYLLAMRFRGSLIHLTIVDSVGPDAVSGCVFEGWQVTLILDGTTPEGRLAEELIAFTSVYSPEAMKGVILDALAEALDRIITPRS